MCICTCPGNKEGVPFPPPPAPFKRYVYVRTPRDYTSKLLQAMNNAHVQQRARGRAQTAALMSVRTFGSGSAVFAAEPWQCEADWEHSMRQHEQRMQRATRACRKSLHLSCVQLIRVRLLEPAKTVNGGYHLLPQKSEELQTRDGHAAALTSRSSSFLHHNTVRPLLNPGCTTSTPRSLPSSSHAILGLQQLQLTHSIHPHEQHLEHVSKR